MKTILFPLIILIVSLHISLAAEPTKKTTSDLTVNGLSYKVSKQSIIKAFGVPIRQHEPHNECGFLSSDEQRQTFYTLQYQSLNWTGNKKKGYIMEELWITKKCKYDIRYKGKQLSSETTQSEFCKITGLPYINTEIVSKNPLHLIEPIKKTDPQMSSESLPIGPEDRYIFYFSDDKLSKIEYWSPC